MTQEKILVTSALPYANGPIHFGHIAGAYLPADIFVRYKRMCSANIVYICGTDDHGVAITISAEKAGVTPSEHVAKYHAVITDIFDRMNIRFDNFSSTSRPHHYEISQAFFRRINQAGYIEPKSSRQFYCPTDRMFLADRYVTGDCPYCGFQGARGDECPSCGKWLDPLEIKAARCKVCSGEPEVRETTNWYLKLDKLEPDLKKWIAEKTHWKENVVNFVNGWFTEGLHERAITRDMSWGIPVPLEEAKGKVLYVWFDAPIGYISSTMEWAEAQGRPEAWRDYWCDPNTRLIHFIGKDNIPFHCIVFPAMIMAQNRADEDVFILPENVPANEFYNLEGRQFSKSEGWYIDLEDFFTKYPVDVIRYTLCANMPEKRDSEFTWRDFQLRNNSDLADTFGNLANRVLTFARKNFDKRIPPRGLLDADGEALLKTIERLPAKVGENLERFEYRRAVFEVLEAAREGNRFFDKQEPWVSVKNDPDRCATTIHMGLHLLKALAVTSCPFMPDTAQRLWALIGQAGQVEEVDWNDDPARQPEPGTVMPKPKILFTKIDDKQIEAEVLQLRQWAEKANSDSAPVDYAPLRDTIAFEDFTKLDLRVGKVLEASPVPKSNKLLLLQVDLGFEKRQVVAGIAKHVSPDQLLGKSVIVVVNLKPVKLMGQQSQGMVLAVKDGNKLSLLAPVDAVRPGMQIS